MLYLQISMDESNHKNSLIYLLGQIYIKLEIE